MPELELIDTHAHLDSSNYDHDRAAVIARAHAARIGVITVGVDVPSSEAAVRLAARHRSIWAGVGIHPHEAKSFSTAVAERLRAFATAEKVVAIGEIGLDYYRDLSPRATQRKVFSEQIELANELELPVIVHNRESSTDMLGILRKHRPRRGVIHSFLGDLALAQKFMELGLYLGIGGPLTFPKNEVLREAVKGIPLDRILVETDCPYLTPVPHRGKRNEPVYVEYVVEALARIKGIPREQVAAATTANAYRVFGL
ncbi:hydrolase TatD [Candidatus Acetothermia bacterium]|nr:MAG: hydrolase TatD [Candidatus Acetothermia bacterium]